MLSKIFPKRFSLLKVFLILFIALSFLIRVVFFIWNLKDVDTSFLKIIYTFIIGFLFDALQTGKEPVSFMDLETLENMDGE